MEEKKENQIRLNPMMPRRYSSKERAELRKKEKEILTGKKDDNIIYPYPVGTYLCKEEYGITHIDRVEEYVINKAKVFVILVLDVFKEPRLSTPIDIDSLLKQWKEYDSDKFNVTLPKDNLPKVKEKTNNNQ